MKSPTQYEHELDQLLKENPVSATKLTAMEQALKLDLHALRMQFKGREVSAIQQSSKKSGSERAEQQKRLAEENTNRTQAYQALLEKVQKAASAE